MLSVSATESESTTQAQTTTSVSLDDDFSTDSFSSISDSLYYANLYLDEFFEDFDDNVISFFQPFSLIGNTILIGVPDVLRYAILITLGVTFFFVVIRTFTRGG